MQKVRDNLLLIAQLITLVCALAVLNKASLLQQESYSTPVMESTSSTPTLDDARLTELLQKEFPTLPQIQPTVVKGAPGNPGADGQPGANGKDGKTPVVDYNTIKDMVKQEVAKLPAPKDGLNGKNGADAPLVELQTNILTGNLEWRYAGYDSWQLLMKKCDLIGVCL